MLEIERIDILKAVKDNFSKATDADGSQVWEAVRGVALEDALAGIAEHRQELGTRAWRPSIRQVKSLAYSRFNARTAHHREYRIIDWIRETDPTAGADAAGAIIGHFSEMWASIRGSNHDEHVKAKLRALIRSHARMAFREIKIPPDQIEECASMVVELQSGEGVPGLSLLLKAIPLTPPPAKSWPQLRELAMATEGGAK